MKKLSKILLVGVVALTMVLPLSASARRKAVDPVAGKYKNLFVFKTDRKLVGGKVEVISASGDIVTTQTMQKRKLFIDFSDVKEGIYVIRVSKGDRVREFKYEK
jgi:hypothetical protein